MKKLIPAAIAATIAGICCIIAAYFCHFYYMLYRHTETDLGRQLNSFDQRLSRLEAHKARNLASVDFWGEISSTDQLEKTLWSSGASTNKDHFETSIGKGNQIYPTIRIPVGSVEKHEYSVHISEQAGHVVDAWFSQAEPYRDLAAFDQFHVYRADGTNTLKLIAQLRTNSSINMRFKIVVLCVSDSD